MHSGFLMLALVLLAASCLVVPIARRLQMGSVLGYLLAGVLIGPHGLGLIYEADEIRHIAEFGVVMMLFLIGLELAPARLWAMRRGIVGLGGLQVTVTTGVLTLAGLAMGYSYAVSMAVAMALSLSSTALVLQMLQEKGLWQTSTGQSAFSVLLFQDIAVIPFLLVLPLLASSPQKAEEVMAHASLIGHYPGWLKTLVIGGTIITIVLAGRYGARFALGFIAGTRLREIFTAFSLLLVVGISVLMQSVGVSPALGAFIAGVVLASSEYRPTLERDIEPFKGLLLGLFFLSVGMGMDIALLSKSLLPVLGAVFGLIAIKFFIIYGLARLFKLQRSASILLSVALAQGGEFAFVLLQYARQLRTISADTSSFITLVVTLSMAITPLLMLLVQGVILPRLFMTVPQKADSFDGETPAPVIIAGYGRYGQIIGRFLKAQGIRRTILENDPSQIALLRRFGNKVYFGDAADEDLLEKAGVESAKVLVVATDDPEKTLAIVSRACARFPHLKVLARARNRRHAWELQKAGATVVRRELVDSSLWMGQQTMRLLGYRAYAMRYKALQFMQQDEKMLQQSFAYFEKTEPELIDFTNEASQELERILRSDSAENTASGKISSWG